MSETDRFAQLAFGGRAILLAGQNLVPGATSLLISLLSGSTERHGSAPRLAEICEGLTDSSGLQEALASSDLRALYQGELRSVAQVPWAAVITSSLDTGLSDAVAETNSEGRRVRHSYLDDPYGRPIQPNPHVVPVAHLARGIEGAGAEGTPICGRRLRRFRTRLIPTFLNGLPVAVGPTHALCIAGVGSDDILSRELLEEVLQDLDPNNVYWFVSESDGLDVEVLKAALPQIHIIEAALGPSIASFTSDAGNADEARRKLAGVLDLEALAITVRSDGSDRIAIFSPRELREFRPHMVLLPDVAAEGSTEGSGDRRDRFIKFLSRPRHSPDWDGFSEGYAFERTSYKKLLDALKLRIARITGRAPTSSRDGKQPADRPIFLAGPPASGRTVGLHWLGCMLRREKVFVAHLLAPGDTVDVAAVEKLLRLAETRDVPYSVVLVDKVDRNAVQSLHRRLRAAGRRAIVVGTATQVRSRGSGSQSEMPTEVEPRGEEILIDYALDHEEMQRFERYLVENQVTTASAIAATLRADPELFALLYRLVPESRTGIRSVLVEEYQKLIAALAEFRPPPASHAVRGNVLRDQLLTWLAKHGTAGGTGTTATDGATPESSWSLLAQRLPRLVLIFSSLDEPIPFDHLVRCFPELLHYYAPVVAALERSNLISEVALDRQENRGLMAVNQLAAQIVLEGVARSTLQQISALGDALSCFPWNSDLTPAEAPDQARLVHLVRSISPPNGTYHDRFSKAEDLKAVAALLKKLREELGFEYSSLMLTEGILLRHLGRKLADAATGQASLPLYRESLNILERAEVLVASRPASPARDHELSAILNASATSLGHIWRELQERSSPLDPECREIAQRVLHNARRAQAYQDNYHALDIAFWLNRDMYRELSTADDIAQSEQARVVLLSNMASAVDAAQELEALPQDQLERLEARQVELEQLVSGNAPARQLADQMAAEGRFGGVCLIARQRAVNPDSGQFVSRSSAREALEYLGTYEPRILGDERAAALMHRLWVASQLGAKRLEDGPHALGCTRSEWEWLERISRARRGPASDAPLPYVYFWLAVALAHQGDPRAAMRLLEEIQAATFSHSFRRLNPLILLADLGGSPIEHRCIVRRREGNEALTVFVPALDTELQVQRRHQGTSSLVNVGRGDEAVIYVGLSYWRPMGIAIDWSVQRA